MNFDFLNGEFKFLVHIYQYGEPTIFSSSPTLADHEAPQIVEEEPNTTLVPCPPPFSVSILVPPCSDCKVEKYAQHVPNTSSHHSHAFMEEVLEWLKKSIAKIHSSIL